MVYANSESHYVVLIEQKNGSWKSYTNFIEVSEQGCLMIKAQPISVALGFAYKKNKNGTFIVGKNTTTYNTYSKSEEEYVSTNGPIEIKKMAVNKAYASKQSYYNLCAVSSLGNLVYYKCFDHTSAKAYADYDGIICISKYHKIPESVPIVEIKQSKKPTPTVAPQPSSIIIEGVEFPVREHFLAKEKAMSDWGGTAAIWSELEHKVDGEIISSTNLWYDSDTIEFTHQGTECDGISLSKISRGYQIAISVKLSGSVLANQNASILKAMVTTLSSEPNLVYEAIFESFTTMNAHGMNEDTYVTIGDCKIKVRVKNGVVYYYIKEIN